MVLDFGLLKNQGIFKPSPEAGQVLKNEGQKEIWEIDGDDVTYDSSYVTIIAEEKLPDARVLTEGEGIDITDGGAGTTLTIAGEDASKTNKGICQFTEGEGIDITASSGDITIAGEESTAVNKGVVIVSPGEGIDVSYASGEATISGEDATTVNKGIAKFNSTDFDVAAGDVTIDDSSTVRTVVAGEGIDVSSPSGNPTISGENATTANKGIASFNTDDFTVSSGAVSLKSKTSYYSVSPVIWQADSSSTYGNVVDLYRYAGNNGTYFAPVNLPQGAVVTACIVYGSDTSETWALVRCALDSTSSSTMATANFDTADSTITNPTIDNAAYTYTLISSQLAAADEIYGGLITYTTDYI